MNYQNTYFESKMAILGRKWLFWVENGHEIGMYVSYVHVSETKIFVWKKITW